MPGLFACLCADNDGMADEMTWTEAQTAFSGATPVEVVRSPREVTVEYRSEAGGVVATSPQIPGFRVGGRRLDEASEAAREALGRFLDPAVKVTSRLVPSPERAAAADDLTALSEELGLYGDA